jgi:putative copper resistance protein D
VTASLIAWRAVLLQYVSFLSAYWMLGAVGFRYAILRSHARATDETPVSVAYGRAATSAAAVGLVGVGLGGVAFIESVLKRAESKHQTFGEAFGAGGAASLVQAVLLGVLLLGFALAWRRVSLGWVIAGASIVAFALRNLLGGRLTAMVNPLHVAGGSLWLGTLFVLVVSGLVQMLRAPLPTKDREQAIAEMVHRFSTVGLTGSAILGVTGLITSWTHLNPLSALWTTPYGYTLITKLLVVTVVLGLGAWNWRRVGPALGNEGGGLMIRRTASTELAFAALVLLITAILVSLPSPKRPDASAQVSTHGAP